MVKSGREKSGAAQADYEAPVSKLLTFGDCLAWEEQFRDPERERLLDELLAADDQGISREKLAQLPPIPSKTERWPNYVEEVGLSVEHVPALIRMATDEALNHADGEALDVWAPVHAWRSLGQLGATDAVEPLIAFLAKERDAEWTREEIPWVLGLIGAAAIAPLEKILNTRSKKEWLRTSACESLERIAVLQPDLKARCIEAVVAQFKDYVRNPKTLNSYMVSTLIELDATEAADLIGQAYGANRVDPYFCGSWPSVQVDMGLAKESDFTPEELKLPPPEWAQPKAARKPTASELGLPTKYEASELSVMFGSGKLAFAKQKPAKKANQGFGCGNGSNAKSKKKKRK